MPVQVLRDIERKLNREQRSLEERETRGFILAAVVIGSSFMVGWLISVIFGGNLHFIEFLLLACVLAVRPTWDIAFGIRKYLQVNDGFREKTAGRNYLASPCGDGRTGTGARIRRNRRHPFLGKIVAAIFWYLLLGLPGAFHHPHLYHDARSHGAST